MNEKLRQAYELAKEQYAAIGVDTEKAMEQLKQIKVSLHCWQGDDINGFLFQDNALTCLLYTSRCV